MHFPVCCRHPSDCIENCKNCHRFYKEITLKISKTCLITYNFWAGVFDGRKIAVLHAGRSLVSCIPKTFWKLQRVTWFPPSVLSNWWLAERNPIKDSCLGGCHANDISLRCYERKHNLKKFKQKTYYFKVSLNRNTYFSQQ